MVKFSDEVFEFFRRCRDCRHKIFDDQPNALGFKKRDARRCNKGQKAEARGAEANARASRTRGDNFIKKYLNYI